MRSSNGLTPDEATPPPPTPFVVCPLDKEEVDERTGLARLAPCTSRGPARFLGEANWATGSRPDAVGALADVDRPSTLDESGPADDEPDPDEEEEEEEEEDDDEVDNVEDVVETEVVDEEVEWDEEDEVELELDSIVCVDCLVVVAVVVEEKATVAEPDESACASDADRVRAKGGGGDGDVRPVTVEAAEGCG